MSYNQELYLIVFLLIVLLVYQLTPKKARWAILLGASYAFFVAVTGSGKKTIIWLVLTTLFTYAIAVWINKIQEKCKEVLKSTEKENASNIKKKYKQKSKRVLILGIVGLVGALLYTHYLGFIVTNINRILSNTGSSKRFTAHVVLAGALGMSFFTMEAIGYIVEVYWGKIKPDKHPMKLALFLSFFPQLTEGPIALYSQTADQLWEGKSLSLENIKRGYIRIFWGLFKTMVVSARLSMVVNTIFDNYKKFGSYQKGVASNGAMIAFVAVAYTIQLYMDFSGSIDIFIGSARLFGIELPENFRQPFSSKSASEFWTRWHISLGTWFRTYIFYPVSVSKTVKKWNKFAKKKFSKHIAKVGVTALCLFPVWMSNGVWHGAGWNYIFYGVYYFVILLLEVALEPTKKKFLKATKIKEKSFGWKTFLTVKTLIIIFTGELFFRADGFLLGCKMFLSMFKNFGISVLLNSEVMLKLGADKADYIAIIIGTVVVFVYDILKEKGLFSYEKLEEFKTPIRWVVYYTLILAYIFLGAYGVGYQQIDLIYAGF